jgi:hypothetical protein
VVLVTGDVVVDHHIYVRGPVTAGRSTKPTLHHVEFGGAAIIERLLNWEDDKRTKAPLRAVLGLVKNVAFYPHCYAEWAPHESTTRTAEKASWRVQCELGYGEPSPAWPSDHRGSDTGAKKGSRVRDSGQSPIGRSGPGRPDILVIDDSGEGFRNTPGLWPAGLNSARTAPDWLVWKMSGDLGGGALWLRLKSSRGALRRLIVLVSAADLRRAGHSISRGLSWERTALDTTRVVKLATTGPLADARHVVVSFQGAGALWVDRSLNRFRSTLVFDPRGAEGDSQESARGKVYGFQASFVAGITWGLATGRAEGKPERAAMLGGVRHGLNARRELQHHGHGFVDGPPPSGFPARHIREKTLGGQPLSFTHVEVPNQMNQQWTILSDSARACGGSGPLYAEARLVALHGLSALAGMPSLEVGAFATVDRHEIESLRRIHELVRQYESRTPQRQPLSLAVFGAPGAGKSFIVEQIARWTLGEDPPYLAVNLSQLYDEKELIGAFHRVRDLVLKGRTPLVLWDEFDAREYCWLRLLLAPMQDGTFQEGQVVHPIGKCVFVFAGGTSTTFDAFQSRHLERRGKEAARAERVWKFAKGPDFISRIHGSLDVLGPNQRRLEPKRRDATPQRDLKDMCFPIRRALFLRGVLGAKGSEQLDIEPALLDALLRMPDYTHGSRSFERILRRLREGGHPIHRGSLPPLEELSSDIAGESIHPDDERRGT